MVVTILLNRTTGRQVEQVVEGLFDEWPGPAELSVAADGRLEEALSPLGLQNKRAETLRKFSRAWVDSTNTTGAPGRDEVAGMPGVGRYGEDAYRIIVEEDLSRRPDDRKLLEFWKFATGG